MPRGSHWKRLAVFSDELNSGKAEVLASVLQANRIEMEWWNRTVAQGNGKHHARNQVKNLGRDAHPHAEEWLMVYRGDWPLAFVLAENAGVSIAAKEPK